MSNIKNTLERLGLISENHIELFSNATRDIQDLKVYRDKRSGVVFIPDHYVGDEEYQRGNYNSVGPVTREITSAEILRNVQRRTSRYAYLAHNRDICDFGCGKGLFLEAVGEVAKSVTGVELEERNIEGLRNKGIPCYTSLDQVDDESIDSMFSFHVIEHLPDPLSVLSEMHSKLRVGGSLLVEVPHARDFLLRDDIGCDAFKNFTLWSQHLVLHTRESIRTLVESVGFDVVLIEGVQRYPLSNHLGWLTDKRPGGHTRHLRQLDTPALEAEYEKALANIDATDTLVLIARKLGS